MHAYGWMHVRYGWLLLWVGFAPAESRAHICTSQAPCVPPVRLCMHARTPHKLPPPVIFCLAITTAFTPNHHLQSRRPIGRPTVRVRCMVQSGHWHKCTFEGLPSDLDALHLELRRTFELAVGPSTQSRSDQSAGLVGRQRGSGVWHGTLWIARVHTHTHMHTHVRMHLGGVRFGWIQPAWFGWTCKLFLKKTGGCCRLLERARSNRAPYARTRPGTDQ